MRLCAVYTTTDRFVIFLHIVFSFVRVHSSSLCLRVSTSMRRMAEDATHRRFSIIVSRIGCFALWCHKLLLWFAANVLHDAEREQGRWSGISVSGTGRVSEVQISLLSRDETVIQSAPSLASPISIQDVLSSPLCLDSGLLFITVNHFRWSYVMELIYLWCLVRHVTPFTLDKREEKYHIENLTALLIFFETA